MWGELGHCTPPASPTGRSTRPHPHRGPGRPAGLVRASGAGDEVGQIHADRAQLLVTTALRWVRSGPSTPRCEPSRTSADATPLSSPTSSRPPSTAVCVVPSATPACRWTTFGRDRGGRRHRRPRPPEDLARQLGIPASARAAGRRRLHPDQPARRHRLGHHRRGLSVRQPSHPPGGTGARPGAACGPSRVAADCITSVRAPGPGHQARVRDVLHQPRRALDRGPRRDQHPVLPAVGPTPAGAVSAGALDSVFGFVAQITLLFGFLLLGLGTLGFGRRVVLRRRSGRPEDDRGTSWPCVVIAVVAVVAVAPLRRRPASILGQLKEALAVLHSPAPSSGSSPSTWPPRSSSRSPSGPCCAPSASTSTSST